MVVWGSIVRLLLTFVSAATDDGDGTMKMGSSTTKASDGTTASSVVAATTTDGEEDSSKIGILKQVPMSKRIDGYN